MKKAYVVGIDVGTTGTKTILFDFEGNALSSGYVEYPCIYPKPNWVEQDAQTLFNAVLKASELAMAASQIDAKEIAAISISAQRSSCIFIDENDQPIKMISWMDNRASEQVEELDLKFGKDEFYRISGLPLNTCWILPKIMWVRQYEQQIWQRTKKVCQVQDYILKQLGADDYYTDEPDAAFWGLWETDNCKYSSELISKFEIDKKILPKVMQSGTKIGEVTSNCVFAKGTPICVGIGDQNSAAIGAGVVESGIVSASLGTGGLATALLNSKYRDATGNTMVTNHALHGMWEFEGLQNAAAVVYKWFSTEIAALENFQSKNNHTNIFEDLNKMIETVPVGAKGLIMMPYFASSAAPRWNSNARGAFLGLTLAHDRACMARACMEGITMEMRDIITAIRKNGFDVNVGRVIGGATKSDIWNQIQADMYNIPVETLAVKDAAVLGAAMCAAVGIGVYENVVQAAKAMVKPAKRFEPISKNVVIYDEMYAIYCDAYESLANGGVYDKISKFQQKF
ncbi:MAG: FGGY family carbohydrate kinase [Christensenellaceae bacterium]